VFRIPGGKVGELEVVASEAPLVLPAGEVLVFLAHHELGFDYVYAHWQGKYDVVTSVDPAGDRRVKGLQGAPIARDVSLPDLAVSVRTAMAKAAKARAEREEGQ
jgi:hypothetical protein